MTAELHRKRAYVKKHNRDSEYEDEKKRVIAEGFLAQLEDQLRGEAEKMKLSHEEECVTAFVIFNHEESLMRCLEDYFFSTSTFNRRFVQPTPLKFRGKFAIKVTPAPEPSNVIWENLETETSDKFKRRAIGGCITFFLLIICVAIIAIAQGKKIDFANSAPKFSFCNKEIPANHFHSYNISADISPLLHDKSKDKLCDGASFFLVYTNANETIQSLTTPKPSIIIDPNVLLVNKCTSACVNPSDTTLCPTLECRHAQKLVGNSNNNTKTTCTSSTTAYKLNTIVGCFCTQSLVYQIGQLGYVKAIEYMSQNERGLCGDFVINYALAQALTIGASMLVPIVNVILKSVLGMIYFFIIIIN